MLDNQWFKKERPLLSLLGMGGGAGGNLTQSPGSGAEDTSPSGITATGGSTGTYSSPAGTSFKYHIFTSDGTFSVPAVAPTGSGKIDYLVVAGGGGGGRRGGAGGAGGLRCTTSVPGFSGGGGALESKKPVHILIISLVSLKIAQVTLHFPLRKLY